MKTKLCIRPDVGMREDRTAYGMAFLCEWPLPGDKVKVVPGSTYEYRMGSIEDSILAAFHAVQWGCDQGYEVIVADKDGCALSIEDFADDTVWHRI